VPAVGVAAAGVLVVVGEVGDRLVFAELRVVFRPVSRLALSRVRSDGTRDLHSRKPLPITNPGCRDLNSNRSASMRPPAVGGARHNRLGPNQGYSIATTIAPLNH